MKTYLKKSRLYELSTENVKLTEVEYRIRVNFIGKNISWRSGMV